jgi:hypothetical protein
MNCQKTIMIPMNKLIKNSEIKTSIEDIKKENVVPSKDSKKKETKDANRSNVKFLELFWDGYSDLGYC